MGNRLPGYSILELSWTLSDPSLPVPRDWLVVASGQYAVASDTPMQLYCRYEGVRVADTVVQCRNTDTDSLETVEYRSGHGIGHVSDGTAFAIENHRGYDDATATTVSATVKDGARPEYDYEAFTVWIPFRSPDVADFGATSLVRYAGINAAESGYDLGRTLGKLSSTSTTTEGSWVDPVDQRALWFPQLNSTDFEILDQLDARQVQWSVPTIPDPGTLRWHVDEAGLAGVSFQLFDPENADSSTRGTFFAGILVSLATSALLLLFDK
jgi:hypothetical protein